MPNPLLRRIPRAEMNEFCGARYDRSLRVYDDATPAEIGANAPELFEWYYSSFYKPVFYEGRVDVKSMELLRNRLAHEHGCLYCQLGDAIAAKEVGISDEQLENIMNENADCFSPQERAVLELAKEMALPNMNGELTPELYRDLSTHFDDGQIYNLGLAAAVLTGMAKFIFVFDIVEKDATCPVMPRRETASAA